jgi:hypothetical protein
MLSVSEITVLAPSVATGTLNPNRPAEAAVEFDAMVFELLLQQSGLLRSLSAGTEGEPPLVGEMFLQTLARQLASQVDLGFGSLLISQAARTTDGEKP